jgi:hypothetical protein
MSLANESLGQSTRSAEYRAKAIEIRDKLKPELADTPFAVEEFDQLSPWILW